MEGERLEITLNMNCTTNFGVEAYSSCLEHSPLVAHILSYVSNV